MRLLVVLVVVMVVVVAVVVAVFLAVEGSRLLFLGALPFAWPGLADYSGCHKWEKGSIMKYRHV